MAKRARLTPGKVAAAPLKAAKGAAGKVSQAAGKVPPASPNPMTNLIITDLVLRGGGQLMRHAVERTLLGTRYPKEKAREIVKGRSIAQTLIGTALARVATRSVPGAIIVGGGLLAKALFDRKGGKRAAAAEGEREVAAQAADGRKKP